METIKFIDLFAGIGGIRTGFEQAAAELGFRPECVFTSEIKESAKTIYRENFGDEPIYGDIRAASCSDIPDFDFLLGGFPCQAFSIAGNRGGFADTRGTLFFEIERILKGKRPKGFLLENVDGLISHDRPKNSKSRLGNTMTTIIEHLLALGYRVSWRVLDSADFGVAQHRRRVYIIGILDTIAREDDMFNILYNFTERHSVLGDVLEHGLETSDSEIARTLLSKYTPAELEGKQLCDKRGGGNNIHTWDIMDTTPDEKEFLNTLLHIRRKKKWAEETGIEWMDGMPLTLSQIRTFWKRDGLEEMLSRLVSMGILRYDYPKRVADVGGIMKRVKDTTLERGYNILSIKFRYELYRILAKDRPTQTLVATDAKRLFVTDGEGLRRLTRRECLRLFGFPETFTLEGVCDDEAYDLLGNSVTVPVIKEVAKRLIGSSYVKKGEI